ncbi:efflux transporter outer membrane subunit [Aristophania vespae]|uniref:Efflux transporter outer membrane subunit n=1 Tax=Aristophania vespae TaxID=2697033 RepID=A0A6P1NH94_9PROT|nr:efflux transporter outer membrane subunit [Aristophania vespae]QHI95032.1 efflux transporter outer membrane subunit [Aristophania vespae]
MLRKASSFGLSSLFLLASCNLAPDYHRPDGKISAKYPADTSSQNQKALRKVTDLGWEDFFTDPRLKRLIELTLTNNRDLASQMAAIVEARGQYQVQNAALFPQISVGGNGMYNSPSDAAGFSFAPGQGEKAGMIRFYQTSIGFSAYEIDLWGRIRNLTRNEKELTLSAAENLRNLWITTVSQLAETYIQWLSDKKLLDLAQRTYKTREATLKLTQLNYDHGQANALTLAQVQSQLEQTSSDIAQQTRAVAIDEHALQLIVGRPLPDDLPPPAPMGQQTMIGDLPEGLPSDLLLQRPDIQAAEHNLKGANAVIGAARAAFFPKVSLTASEGTSSLQFRKLFSNIAQTWSVSPNISIPLLTWGQNTGNLRSAKARAQAAAVQYQKTVQTAFKEVSDALTARETYKTQDTHMSSLVGQSKKAYDLAYMRFRAGIDDYLTTLVQERQLYQDQQSQIIVQAARFQNMVTLYRALGGGWSRKTEPQQVPKTVLKVAQ